MYKKIKGFNKDNFLLYFQIDLTRKGYWTLTQGLGGITV